MRHEAESLFADDVELVTRDGTLHGPQRLFDDLETQLRHSMLSLDLRDVLGAEDGRVIGVTKFTRKSRQNPADHFWNLGGFVFGVRDGRIVFSEGYPNARRACEALGVDPALVP
jgi:ketosteroid isomerase-like protein